MTSYTTVEYYTDNYLMGREAVIDTASFPFYALKATRIINQYTFGNIDESNLIDEVQMCCCEIAEFIYNTEQQERPKGIQSEKVGEYSITYEKDTDIDAQKYSALKSIIYNWLSDTGLLYRGL